MSVPGDAAVQEQAQPVVVEVAEAVSDALDLLDHEVDGFGGSVADAGVVEGGEKLVPPGVEDAGQASELGDMGVGAAGCRGRGPRSSPSPTTPRTPSPPALPSARPDRPAGRPRPGPVRSTTSGPGSPGGTRSTSAPHISARGSATPASPTPRSPSGPRPAGPAPTPGAELQTSPTSRTSRTGPWSPCSPPPARAQRHARRPRAAPARRARESPSLHYRCPSPGASSTRVHTPRILRPRPDLRPRTATVSPPGHHAWLRRAAELRSARGQRGSDAARPGRSTAAQISPEAVCRVGVGEFAAPV